VIISKIMTQRRINSWIKTSCGRAKYAELNSRQGVLAKIRLYWFVLFAAIRDWNLTNQDSTED
jgi:hypothetical protein